MTITKMKTGLSDIYKGEGGWWSKYRPFLGESVQFRCFKCKATSAHGFHNISSRRFICADCITVKEGTV